MMTAPTTPTVQTITLDTMLYNVLKKRQTDGGDNAMKEHAALAAGIYGLTAEVISDSFVAMRKTEQEREALDAKNKRIVAKAEKVKEYITIVKNFTPSKTFVEMMEKGRALVDSLSDADSKVTFNVTVGFSDDGKNVILTPNFTGISAVSGAAKRATPTGNGDKGDKSRISPWEAYQRGKAAGDPFTISKVEKGKFRDETKNADIPPRGFTKWIRENYPESKTAAVLREYNQL
jgi:hypothetical protein